VNLPVRPHHIDQHDAAGTQVDLDTGIGETMRAPPLLDVLRLGPRVEDKVARGVKGAGDDDVLLRGLTRATTRCGHVCSPWIAGREGSRPIDRSGLPKTGGTAPASLP